MFSKVYTAALMGINVHLIEVETHMEGNVPAYNLVGLLNLIRGIIREHPFRSPHHTISEAIILQ